MVAGIPRERIEGLAKRLYYPESGEPTAEDREEARGFVENTFATIAASPLAYRNLGLFLGIKEADLPPAPKPAAPKPDEEAPELTDDELTDDELIEELRLQTADGTGFELNSDLFRSIVLADGDLLKDADRWGAGDTVVRESAYSVFSQALLGRDWPIYRDGIGEDGLKSFLDELKVAHDERVASAA